MSRMSMETVSGDSGWLTVKPVTSSCVREHVLADPGRRQVGQHVFAVGQLLHVGHGAGAVDQGVVREHHALGLPVVPDV